MSEEEELKTCYHCKAIKPNSHFYKDNKSSDGLASWCKICRREYVAQWQKDNRPRYRKLMRNHYYKHQKEYMEYQRNYREDKQKLVVHDYRKHKPDALPLANACEFCGAIAGLIRHHPTYEDAEFYVTVCRKCHWWIHYG